MSASVSPSVTPSVVSDCVTTSAAVVVLASLPEQAVMAAAAIMAVPKTANFLFIITSPHLSDFQYHFLYVKAAFPESGMSMHPCEIRISSTASGDTL